MTNTTKHSERRRTALQFHKLVEFKHIISKYLYRIEAKPGGGFIATCNDSTLLPIEGATREEVQQKIQDRINADLAAQLPALKSALASNDIKLHYHIEAKPGGGYIVHHGDRNSTDPAHAPIEGSTREHVENLIESKIFSMIMQKLPPELHQQITDKLNSGGLDINVDRRITVTTQRGSLFAPAFGKDIPSFADQNSASGSDANLLDAKLHSASDQSPIIRYDSDSPVRYEKNKGGGNIIRFLLALAIIALIMYLFLRHH